MAEKAVRLNPVTPPGYFNSLEDAYCQRSIGRFEEGIALQ